MVCDALREMLRAARLLNTPVHISHLKAMGPRNWNRRIPEALALLQQARDEGLDVSCDVYPYCAPKSFSRIPTHTTVVKKTIAEVE